ncbi:F-box/FBD/LRR-repeat protein At1g78750-like [Vicia villosa]|uniref:F-box/FBD/LRR-repeat protein At1g78750-like n=1 Tax=Vicia villosa TaxID=3911 RepID=UPI00273BD995|nr:F-box/FBD/LRR-repeat protein At1g78750-like [Vicia villosa]XP_058752046.1 F-box/FBD/LRR-repeat protein At1g78750-like [Vicia villosa]
MDELPDLPDCVLSYIFSKLPVVDLLRTSVLSKKWIHEWGSRTDLNIDIHNMFNQDTLHKTYGDFLVRLDQFILHYPGATIRSVKLNYPLEDDIFSDIVDNFISQVISKGAQRIELLCSKHNSPDIHFITGKDTYKFSFTHTNHSLNYLHLQNCRLSPSIDFTQLKSLTTLVLHLLNLKQHMLSGILSNCVNLQDLTLKNCLYDFDVDITSPSLCHLKIVDHIKLWRTIHWKLWLDIYALNLSSFEFSSRLASFKLNNIKAPKLSKFNCNCKTIPPYVFCGMDKLKQLVLVEVLVPKDSLPALFSNCLQLEELTFWGCTFESSISIISPTLHRLNIIDFDCVPWDLDIDALNLSSFDYRGQLTIRSIKAPQLLNLFWNTTKNEQIPHAFDIIATLHQLHNLSINLSHSNIAILPSSLGPFQHLRKLNLFIGGGDSSDPNYPFFRILDIVMASPLLQELCINIGDTQSGANDTYQRLFARHRHLWENMSCLKKITFESGDRFYVGAGIWNTGSGSDDDKCVSSGISFMCERLKDEVMNNDYLSFCSIVD